MQLLVCEIQRYYQEERRCSLFEFGFTSYLGLITNKTGMIIIATFIYLVSHCYCIFHVVLILSFIQHKSFYTCLWSVGGSSQVEKMRVEGHLVEHREGEL